MSTQFTKSIQTMHQGQLVNDTHSALNPTIVSEIHTPRNLSDLVHAVKKASVNQDRICIAGGRHAMGGQQFLQSGVLLDMSSLNQTLRFEPETGLLEVESGIFWPDLVNYLSQQKGEKQWSIAQKQTGCDRLSIGGALSANVHGRGLHLPPIIGDVEDFTIVSADGAVIKCSRSNNKELFGLAIGGYGLFGIITSATLRLVPKTILQRRVELAQSSSVIELLEKRGSDGATYGDFQFAIDNKSPEFLKSGILSTYTPVEAPPISTKNKLLEVADWKELLYLAHTNKSAAFDKYSRHYLSTDGQLYDADTFQLATYIDGYHNEIDERTCTKGTELITELYVPRALLSSFLNSAADLLVDQEANVIYGTVRLIEQDRESYLPWATQPWACVVLNLHVEHSANGTARASRAFHDLIQLAIEYGGSYYLTYHRFASSQQLLNCYPQIGEFIALKTRYDPLHRFSSNWFDHCQNLLGHNQAGYR